MITPRLFSVALAACAFAGPAPATEDPAAEVASTPTTLTKPTELVTSIDCDPSVAGSCTDLGEVAPASQTLETPATKLPPVVASEG